MNYTLPVDGYGKVTGHATAGPMGALSYDFVDAPAVIHIQRKGAMKYSPRYGIVEDRVTEEKWWNDPLSWYAGSFTLELTDPDTVTLQSATLSD
jgi:hypothetical protein